MQTGQQPTETAGGEQLDALGPVLADRCADAPPERCESRPVVSLEARAHLVGGCSTPALSAALWGHGLADPR